LKIADLASDPALVPDNLAPVERRRRTNYILIRLRGDQTLRGTNSPGEIADAKVAAANTKLTSELTSAAGRATWIATQMANLETANKLVSLEEADLDQELLAPYLADQLIPGTKPDKLKAKRKEVVKTITWWATASDPQLLDPLRGGDLLKLVDRRLRVAERMLYYVGENPRSPWPFVDGGNRMFDYPRPNPQAALNQPNRVGAAAASLWNGPGGDRGYSFVLAQGASPSQAVSALFTPKIDRSKRNLFFCDQVLMSLHIEAFMLAERNARQGDDAWFNTLVGGKFPGWLRVDDPWRTNITFLGSEDETSFFEHKSIGIADLQVGDQLIVYNHPLFSTFLPDSEWQLENSLVVQVDPKLLIQGHGTPPLTVTGMIDRLLEQCNDEIKTARAKVEADPLVKNPTEDPANLYPTIVLGTGPNAPRCSAVRRVPPSQSAYAADKRMADWWLWWTPLRNREGEYDLYTKPTTDTAVQNRRNIVKEKQKIEIIREDPALAPNRSGFFFPLWEPNLQKSGQTTTPVKNAQGKVSGIHEVRVTVDMASLDTFYFPTPFHRGVTTAIRPKVN
jgi:hypothetical protein